VGAGDIHHTSGLYKIFKVTNTIQAGRFVSTLDMQRSSSKIKQSVAGEVIYVQDPGSSMEKEFTSGVKIYDIGAE
jgi:hypothetical protein